MDLVTILMPRRRHGGEFIEAANVVGLLVAIARLAAVTAASSSRPVDGQALAA